MPKPPTPRKGTDYYIENGLFVFTEHFLLKRGCAVRVDADTAHGYKKKQEEHKNNGGQNNG